MRNLRYLFIIPMLMLFVSAYSQTASDKGASDMKQVLSRPDSVTEDIFLGLDLNTRLDMIDYMEGGFDVYTRGPLQSEIKITKLEDRHVRIETPQPVSMDAYLLTPKNDSIIVIVITTPVGAGDAIVQVRNLRTGDDYMFETPEYTDWLKDKALKTVTPSLLLNTIPFVSAQATVNPVEETLTFINMSIKAPGIEENVVDAFFPELVYNWNGKRFVRKK